MTLSNLKRARLNSTISARSTPYLYSKREVIMPFKFDGVMPFSDDLANIQKVREEYYIDTKGKK